MCIASHIGWEGRTFGFLACYFDKEIEIDVATRNFFMSIAGACSAALEKEELLRIISELRQFDLETGIYTHQYFIARLEKEIQQSQINSTPLSLVIMDMDNYKATINLYGNEAAQEVLKSAAEELKTRIRGCDVLGSLGIDEFVLLMPDADHKYAEQIINSFNERLKSKTFTNRNIKTSFSCGITQLHHADDLDGLMHRAQLALYNARKTGEGTLSIVP
jgi:two-component system cell cycle response regulator